MKFFIDTANLDQIKEAQDMGILDGVTTNPSLMAKEGITGEKNIIDHYKGKFIAQTDRNAPYGRVVLIDPKNPGEEHWLTLLNGNKNEVLNSTTLVGGKLFAHFTRDVLSIWKVYAPNGDFLYKVDLPGKGIINGFNGHLTDKITWYSFNNFVTPTEIYQYNIQNKILVTLNNSKNVNISKIKRDFLINSSCSISD